MVSRCPGWVGWGPSPVFCLQLIWKEVASTGIQELLAPLNLELKQPLEKVSAWAGLPRVPMCAPRPPRGSECGGACGC